MQYTTLKQETFQTNNGKVKLSLLEDICNNMSVHEMCTQKGIPGKVLYSNTYFPVKDDKLYNHIKEMYEEVQDQYIEEQTHLGRS